MPENIDPSAPDANGGSGDPRQLAAWILGAAQRVAHGQPLDNSGQWDPAHGKFGIPAGYAVNNGRLEQDTRLWSSIYKGLLGTAGMATLGVLLGPTLAAGSGAAAAGAGVGATGAGTAATAGGASSVVSAAAPAAAAAAGPLASTQIGNGAGAPAGSTAVPPGSSMTPTSTSSLTGSGADGLPDWLKLAQDVGGAMGAGASGRAQGRNADNLANIGFAQAQNDLYNSELAAPGKIAHNAVRGDILSNARDVSIAAPDNIPVPQISGGLRPSMFSDTTRQLGKDITANAAATPMPVATPPVLQPMETAGATDDILNTAGYLSSFAKPGYDIWKMFNHA